jgi:2,4-dienoyl-CoA reductase-like NADH-dependent reductase (Old Yellow Enzyme family)
MLMIDRDALIPAYAELIQSVHEYDTSIILQIAHCGREARSKITGLPTVAPSAIRSKLYSEDMPRELTESGIGEIIENFVNGVRRAQQAGFDGVQLHLAHGFLLAEFLSPHTNRRTDRWGGSTENRFRIVREILTRARAQVGDYPIWVKLNAHDGQKHGMRVEEAVKIARLLEEAGCSAIEVSCGALDDGAYSARNPKNPTEAMFAYHFKFKCTPAWLKPVIRVAADLIVPPARPLRNYNVPAAQAMKAAVSIPVIVVGGLHALDDIVDVFERQQADAVSMCRPFIIEPNIVNKFKEGRQTASCCLMCNYCGVAQQERPLQCYYGKVKL